MKNIFLIAAFVLCAGVANAGYYFGLCQAPINGGPCYDVGPYSTKGINGCADWCGFMSLDFPAQCEGICNASCPCPITGNGAAYPNDYPCTAGTPNCPNPAPTIPDCYCSTTPKYGGAGFQKNRFYFVIYDTTGLYYSGPYTTLSTCRHEQVLFENFNNDEDVLANGIPGLDCFGVF